MMKREITTSIEIFWSEQTNHKFNFFIHTVHDSVSKSNPPK